LADPSDRLRSLCRRLKLRADDEAVGAMLHPERSPFASMGPVGANLGDDRDFLRRPRVDWQALQAHLWSLPVPGARTVATDPARPAKARHQSGL
jgi:hypothetical protein